MFEVYKPAQGKYTRVITFVAVMATAVIGVYLLSKKLEGANVYVQYGVPTAIMLGLAWLMFWLVNRQKSADFLIATEGEMKKVSWSSRKEVIGSTKVVIITTMILAAILYGMDVFLSVMFRFLGIMG